MAIRREIVAVINDGGVLHNVRLRNNLFAQAHDPEAPPGALEIEEDTLYERRCAGAFINPHVGKWEEEYLKGREIIEIPKLRTPNDMVAQIEEMSMKYMENFGQDGCLVRIMPRLWVLDSYSNYKVVICQQQDQPTQFVLMCLNDVKRSDIIRVAK
ncbi:MAG: hypothetical protein ACREGB_01415 [Candidatus Saccharimonadales bacterium]